MKKLNNKGYLLVEVVVAFALAMSIMYLIADLTIKVKNRNDDLMVRTLTTTDQTIIYNVVMQDGFSKTPSCTTTSPYKVTYNGKTIILNEYVDSLSCTSTSINIGVKVLSDSFNIVKP